MVEITIHITLDNFHYVCEEGLRILDAKRDYLPEAAQIKEIHFERDWIPGKTRITFKYTMATETT